MDQYELQLWIDRARKYVRYPKLRPRRGCWATANGKEFRTWAAAYHYTASLIADWVLKQKGYPGVAPLMPGEREYKASRDRIRRSIRYWESKEREKDDHVRDGASAADNRGRRVLR